VSSRRLFLIAPRLSPFVLSSPSLPPAQSSSKRSLTMPRFTHSLTDSRYTFERVDSMSVFFVLRASSAFSTVRMAAKLLLPDPFAPPSSCWSFQARSLLFSWILYKPKRSDLPAISIPTFFRSSLSSILGSLGLARRRLSLSSLLGVS